jgi:hypothetical protein
LASRRNATEFAGSFATLTCIVGTGPYDGIPRQERPRQSPAEECSAAEALIACYMALTAGTRCGEL